jgi:hypothetical protein
MRCTQKRVNCFTRLPPAVTAMEREGIKTRKGEQNREIEERNKRRAEEHL